MKKVILGAILLLGIGVFFYSCEKEQNKNSRSVNEISLSNQQNGNLIDENQIYSQDKNNLSFENPMSNYGDIHNVLIEAIRNSAIKNNRTYSKNEMYDFYKEYLLVNYDVELDLTFSQVEEMWTEYLNYSFMDNIKKLQANGKINQTQYDIIAKIEQSVNESKNINQFLNKIHDLNLEINSNNLLLANEKEYLFLLTSVAEKSYEFWDYNSNNYGTLDKAKCNRFWQISCIVMWDVLGAAGGSITTGWYGAIAGAGMLSWYARCCLCCTCLWVSC